MPEYLKRLTLEEQVARLADRVALLARTSRPAGELPLFPVSFRGLVYEDTTSFTTTWETRFTPAAAWLDLGLVLIGDVVGVTNTGGEWRVTLNGVEVASGSVPATFSYQLPALSLSLADYQASSEVVVAVQTRRTSGSGSGGLYGNGGSIGSAPRYAKFR